MTMVMCLSGILSGHWVLLASREIPPVESLALPLLQPVVSMVISQGTALNRPDWLKMRAVSYDLSFLLI